MPVLDSPTTTQRLLTLLSLLQARRDWSAPALAKRMGVSERTIRRDVDRLRELDYTISATRGPDGGYRLEAGSQLPPLLFDDEQAITVWLALQTAGALGAGLEEAATRTLATISRLLPPHLARRLDSLEVSAASQTGRVTVSVDPAVVVRIAEAIRAGEELRFDYDSPRTSSQDEAAGDTHSRTGTLPAPRAVEPHHLLVDGGRWYLIGFSRDRDDWRVYRVDRIHPRSHNGRRFTRRQVPGGDAAAFLSARFKGSERADVWPCVGEATLAGSLSSIAPFVGDGEVEELTPGRCRLRLGSWSWAGVAAAFSRFDREMSDVNPADLRAAFAVLAQRATTASGECGPSSGG